MTQLVNVTLTRPAYVYQTTRHVARPATPTAPDEQTLSHNLGSQR